MIPDDLQQRYRIPQSSSGVGITYSECVRLAGLCASQLFRIKEVLHTLPLPQETGERLERVYDEVEKRRRQLWNDALFIHGIEESNLKDFDV